MSLAPLRYSSIRLRLRATGRSVDWRLQPYRVQFVFQKHSVDRRLRLCVAASHVLENQCSCFSLVKLPRCHVNGVIFALRH